MNLDIVDDVLKQEEAILLREYIELERTPVPQALFVSALSQLWVFGMYELLRTWRQRLNDVLKFVYAAQKMKAAERKAFIDAKRRKVKRITQHAIDSPWQYFSKALRGKKFRSQLENAFDRSELADAASSTKNSRGPSTRTHSPTPSREKRACWEPRPVGRSCLLRMTDLNSYR